MVKSMFTNEMHPFYGVHNVIPCAAVAQPRFIETCEKLRQELPYLRDVQIDVGSRAFRKFVRDICQYYYAQRAADQRPTLGDAGVYALRIQGAISGLSEVINNAPLHANFAIFRATGEQVDITRVMADLSQWSEGCGRVVASENAMGRKPNRAIENAVGTLARCWTVLTGRAFPLTIDLDGGPEGQGENRNLRTFRSPAAHFVSELMKSIDPDVTTKQVRTALRKKAWLKGTEKTRRKPHIMNF
jgi:hypothetical protein